MSISNSTGSSSFLIYLCLIIIGLLVFKVNNWRSFVIHPMHGVYNSWKSPGIVLMLLVLENLIVS